MVANCTIAVEKEIREKLLRYKIIPEETYNSIIKRLMEQMDLPSLPVEQKRLTVKH